MGVGAGERRGGDDDRRGRQFRRAGAHLRHAARRHRARALAAQAVGARPRLLPPHPHGLHHPQEAHVRRVPLARLHTG